MANCNYKVNIKDIQSKYSFKIFCSSDNAEIQAEIGNLENLTTTAKDNLVNAINEVDGNTTTNATAISGLQSSKEDKSNKVTSISSTSTDTQYPSAKAVYDSQVTQDETISTLETNLEETKEELDYYKTIYNVLPKVEGNGESITLDNTGESILKLDPRGQCKQDSTNGNNLIDTRGGTTLTDNDITFTPTYNSKGELERIKVNGTASAMASYMFPNYVTLKAGTYYISKGDINGVRMLLVDSGGTSYITTGTTEAEQSFTLSADKSVRLWLRVYSGASIDNAILYPMVAITSGATYEPFTFGASPNPTYPQQIHEVSGDNEINVIGKNLSPINKATVTGTTTSYGTIGSISGTIVVKDIPIKPNTKYYISLNKPSQLSQCVVWFYNGKLNATSQNGAYNELYSGGRGTSQGISSSGNTNANYEYMAVSLGNDSSYTASTSITIEVSEIMVREEGTTDEYEPYNRDTYELSLGDIKMRGIGTYEDYFVRNSGKNLFDINAFETQLVNGKILDDNGNEVNDNTSTYSRYKIFLKANETIHIEGWFQRIYYYDENGSFKSRSVSGGTSKMSTTYTPTTNEYIGFQIRNEIWASNKGQEMINLGTTALLYEPYGTGKWCKYNSIGNIVLDGDSIMSGFSTHSGTTYITANYQNSSIKQVGENQVGIKCDKLRGTNINNTWTGNMLNSCSLSANGKYIQICLPYSVATTLQELRTWLSSNNLTMDYWLSTPYLSLIENETLISQLDKVEKALAKQGQTNISQVNNDIPFKIYATALKEIE